ncbi:ribonuclease HII [archaeon]|nr:ribonuclease HII [archaeon]
MKTILGIDEAGKGPVIGPMVLAGVAIEQDKLELLKRMGIKDSKLIPPAIREDLFIEIKKIAKHKIIIISPQEIDVALNSPDSNLNKLEGIKMAEIINALKADESIIDCPSVNTKAFSEFMDTKIKVKTKLICEHKADLNYVVVGAASILAKVTRDAEIEKIRKKYGEVGPGYPSNPITIAFLKQNWEKHPHLFRKTWKTYQKVAQSKNQSSLKEY